MDRSNATIHATVAPGTRIKIGRTDLRRWQTKQMVDVLFKEKVYELEPLITDTAEDAVTK